MQLNRMILRMHRGNKTRTSEERPPLHTNGVESPLAALEEAGRSTEHGSEVFSRLPRAQLVKAASEASGPNGAIQAFRTLMRLSNFRSACAAARHLDLSEIDDDCALLVARGMLSSDRGIEGDRLLEHRLKRHDGQPPAKALASFGEAISDSGWPHDRKVDTLSALLGHLQESHPDNHKVRRKLKWQLFKLVRNSDPELDLPYFAELDLLDVDNPSYQLKFVEQMRSLGYAPELAHLLDAATDRHGVGQVNVLLAQLKLDPLWLDSCAVDASDLAEHTDRVPLLRVAGAHAGASEKIAALYRACIERQLSEFGRRTIFEQNAILVTLAMNDEIDLVLELADTHDLPDTALPVTSCRALRCFAADDWYSAKDMFMSVLKEDPGNSFAGDGLQLTMPRTGEPIDAVLQVRRELGHGIRSAGRTGVRMDVGNEGTRAHLSVGDYARGFYSKRHRRLWRVLKSAFGDRFLNCERLPRGKEGSLFVIADDGIGDELRTAQFYGELTERFERVTISCDPRLQTLLTRSFPKIEFLPALRYRRGLHDRHGRLGVRLTGFPGNAQYLLTEDCRPLLESADRITFGQNLFFNHFIGEIGRAEAGPYLTASPRSLSADDKLRVGILWRSHLQTLWRKLTHLSVSDFAPITRLDGIEFWSIQHATNDSELLFCEENGIRVIDDIDLFNDFEGLASYVKGLDLAVGLSSAPLELAAAVGTPVWMPGFSPENYFMRTRGGTTADDQLTRNATIVAPPWIDFTASREECVDIVMREIRERLQAERDLKRARAGRAIAG